MIDGLHEHSVSKNDQPGVQGCMEQLIVQTAFFNSAFSLGGTVKFLGGSKYSRRCGKWFS